MHIKEGTTFWGQKMEATEHGQGIAEILGAMDPGPQQAEAADLYRAAQVTGLNARQQIDGMRSMQGEPIEPTKPNTVQQEAPVEINVYTDGAVRFPAVRHFAPGGFGLWWPGWTLQQLTSSGAINDVRNCLKIQQWERGVAMWGPLNGNWHSSGRAELAALVPITHFGYPIHIGIDNKAVVDMGAAINQNC